MNNMNKNNENILHAVQSDLEPIKKQLRELSDRYSKRGEHRIGWTILNAVGDLDEAIRLAALYLSGEKLPTLNEIQGIYKTNAEDVSKKQD